MKYIISIDIGLIGGMALLLLGEEIKIIELLPVPTIDVLVNKKIRKQYDIQEINRIIKRWSTEHEIKTGGFERLRAIPSQMAQTAFSMGGGAMLFKTIFTVYNIPFVEVEPRTWQQFVFKELNIQYSKETTKQASIQAAKRLFPETNFHRTERARTDCDGLTDSVLLGYYLLKK